MQDLHACLNSVTQVTDSSPGLGAPRTTLAQLIKLHDRLYLPVQTIFTVLNKLKGKIRSQNESEQNIFISSIKNLHLSYN